MPGELITSEGQVELQGLLLGVYGESWLTGPPGGLLSIGAKTNDVDLGHADGVYAGPDFVEAKLITVPLAFVPSVRAAVMQAFTPGSVDVELHMSIPNWGHVWMVGRPRGIAEGNLDLFAGQPAITCLGLFLATDPTIYEDESS